MHTGGKREASESTRLSVASQGLGRGAVRQGLGLGQGTARANLPKHPAFVFGRLTPSFCCCSSNLLFFFQFFFDVWCVCMYACLFSYVRARVAACACGGPSWVAG